MESNTSKHIPVFDGSNYKMWRIQMETIFMSMGVDVEESIELGYIAPQKGKKLDENEKLARTANGKAMRTLFTAMSLPERSKVMDCKSAKEIWDRLQSIYQGDNRIMESKLQVFKKKYHELKMEEKESVQEFFIRLTEVLNDMSSHGKHKKDISVIKKVMRDLPAKFIPRVETLEHSPELSRMTLQEFQSSLTAFEMKLTGIGEASKSTNLSNPKPVKEIAFKAMKQLRIADEEESEFEDENYEESEDNSEGEVVAYYTRKFRKGASNSRGRGGKSSLTLRCYRCGKRGHFASNCKVKIEDKDGDSEEELQRRWNRPSTSSRKATYRKGPTFNNNKGNSQKNYVSQVVEDDSEDDSDEFAFVATVEIDEEAEDIEENFNEDDEEEEEEEDDRDRETLIRDYRNLEAELTEAVHHVNLRGDKLKQVMAKLKKVEKERDEAQEDSKNAEHKCIEIKVKLEEQIKTCADLMQELDERASKIEEMEKELMKLWTIQWCYPNGIYKPLG